MPRKKNGFIDFFMKREYGNLNCTESSTSAENEGQMIGEEKSTIPVINKACGLSGHSRSTFLVAFSRDRSKIASTHGDHTVRVTEVRTGKCTHVLRGHPRTPWSIAFHPSSNDILATGCLGGEVRIWDLRGGGSEIWKSDQGRVIASLAFHPTDQVLVIATNNQLLFWDWSKPEPFAKCTTASEHEKVRWCKFDPIGHYLYTGIANKCTINADEFEVNSLFEGPDRRFYDHYSRMFNDRLSNTPDVDIIEPRSPNHQEALRDARIYAEQISQQNQRRRQLQLQRARQYAASVTPSHSNQAGTRIEIGRVEGPTAPDLDDTDDHMQQIHRIPNVYAPSTRSSSSLETLAQAAAAVSQMDTLSPLGTHSSFVHQQPTTSNRFLPNTSSDFQTVFSRLGRSSVETVSNSEENEILQDHSLQQIQETVSSSLTTVLDRVPPPTLFQEPSASTELNSPPSGISIDNPVNSSGIDSSPSESSRLNLPSGDVSLNIEMESNTAENNTTSNEQNSAQNFVVSVEQNQNPTTDLNVGNNLWQTFEGSSLNIEIPSMTPNSDDSNSMSGPLRTPRNSTEVDRPPLPVTGNVGLIQPVNISNASSTVVNYGYPAQNELHSNEVISFPADPVSAFSQHSAQIEIVENPRSSSVQNNRAVNSAGNRHRNRRLLPHRGADAQPHSNRRQNLFQSRARNSSSRPGVNSSDPNNETSSENLLRLLETPVPSTSNRSATLGSRYSSVPQPVPPVTQTPTFQGRNSDLRQSLTRSLTSSPPARNRRSGVPCLAHRRRGCEDCANRRAFLVSRLQNARLRDPNATIDDLRRRRPSSSLNGRSELGASSTVNSSSVTSVSSSNQPPRLATIIESEVREALTRIHSRRINISETIQNLADIQRNLADIPVLIRRPTDENAPRRSDNRPDSNEPMERNGDAVPIESIEVTTRTESNDSTVTPALNRQQIDAISERLENQNTNSLSVEDPPDLEILTDDLGARIDRLDQRVSEIQRHLGNQVQSMGFVSSSPRVPGNLPSQIRDTSARLQRMQRHLDYLDRSRQERRAHIRSRRIRRSNPLASALSALQNERDGPAASRLRNLYEEFRNMQEELSRRRDRQAENVDRRRFDLLDEAISRENDFQATINRTIANALMNQGESSIASNIVNLTHRVQRWDFSRGQIPEISDPAVNVVIPYCKLHNDATVDISQDGKLLAMFIPSEGGFPDDTLLGVYSLENPTVGKCLYTKSFGPNAISVSISPLNNYVLVGLAAKRLQWVFAPKQMVAQIYRLKKEGAGEDSMEHICDLMHPCDIDLRMHVSVNSARWLPGVGEGVVYCTNRGDLHLCQPGWEKNSAMPPNNESTNDERQTSGVRTTMVQLLRIGNLRTNNRATQTTTTQAVRRSASTQTDDVETDSESD